MQKRAILFGVPDITPARSCTAKPLPAVRNDVINLSKKLKILNFSTCNYINPTREEILNQLQEFANKAPCDSLNIIYFSGHGGQYHGMNYIYPTDVGISLDSRRSLDESAFNLNLIHPLFSREVKLLIIIDACRKDISPEIISNFCEIKAPKNTYIAYSSQFGTSSSANNEYSYFTNALCEHILEANISVDELFTKVRYSLYNSADSQISNCVDGLLQPLYLNTQPNSDDLGQAVLNFVDTFGDMYAEKYGAFSGDDMVFIDAAQYCGISVLDAIYKFQTLDAARYHVEDSLSEDEHKLISFWGMLDTGLKQDEFYTWSYRGRAIRLGEIPPLPLSMQKPRPNPNNEINVEFHPSILSQQIRIETNLPEKFKFSIKVNEQDYGCAEVTSGHIIISLEKLNEPLSTINLTSVLTTTAGVDTSIVGEKCRNLTGRYVKYHPIFGNQVQAVFSIIKEEVK